jgi:site-specific DNA recombinase
MKTAAIMSRVSSDEQAKGYSPEVQEQSLIQHCKRNDIQILYQFREHHSAKTFDRPEFIKFRKGVSTGKIKVDTLLFTSWDRFSRNLRESLTVIDWLSKHGIASEAIEQPLDMTVPENLALLAMYLALPEIDNTRRSIKIKGGIRGAQKKGRWVNNAPIGYKNCRDETNKPIIVPSQKAEFIQKAFSEITNGREQVEIRRMLEKKGIKISRSHLSRILRNPVYMGKIAIPAFNEEPSQLINGLHEPLISENLFFKVQNMLCEKIRLKNKPKSKTNRPELPLRGSLLCSNCGRKHTGSPSSGHTGKKYFYYHCNHCHKERFSADDVNEAVSKLLVSLKFKGTANDLFKQILEDVLKEKKTTGITDIQQAEKTLSELQCRIIKLQDLLTAGTISTDDYIQMKTRYEGDRNKIEPQIKTFKSTDKFMQAKINKCFGILTHLDELFDNANLDNKNKLISSIFPEKLYFDGKKCRTPRMNEVLLLALSIDVGSKKNKKGQNTSKSTLSPTVECTGVEPVISGLRTRRSSQLS